LKNYQSLKMMRVLKNLQAKYSKQDFLILN
jgi:hypothetical protein